MSYNDPPMAWTEVGVREDKRMKTSTDRYFSFSAGAKAELRHSCRHASTALRQFVQFLPTGRSVECSAV